ncbi:MAG: PilZ domain-containing protein [Candidatus Acidiferrum sp.]
MKRRKRKRSSKAANPPTPEIPIDAEKAAEPSAALAEADHQTPPREEFIAPVEVEKSAEPSAVVAEADYVIDLGDEFIATVEEEKAAGDSVALDGADRGTPLRDQFTAAVEEEKAAGPSAAAAGADRRIHPRYEFVAAVEVVAAESGARIETRVRDLSQQGCYVDTSNALPLGTVTDVRITKGAQLFEAPARVVYSRAGKGMGLVFTAIEPEQLQTLETWLAESRETSWLAANRRRSQRVLMTIPVRVSGKTGAGSPFEEATHTRAISAHGALILMSAPVYRGQRLTLSNIQTKAALECVVAHIDRRKDPQAGVEFTLPNPMFWHVAFPPKDWTPRHPDAKSRVKTDESS